MKKIFLTVVMLCVVFSPLTAKGIFSQASSRPECVGDELSTLLEKKHFDRNAEEIHNLTFSMTALERESVFDFYKLDGNKAASGNCGSGYFPGFGFGSFSQGDAGFGTLLLVSDLVGYVIAMGGAAVSVVGVVMVGATLGLLLYDDKTVSMIAYGGIAFGAGMGILLVDMIIGMIRPKVYAKKQNAALRTALGLDEPSEEISFAPIIDPVNKKLGLALSMRL